MSTWITIYFIIGFIMFLGFQYKASKKAKFSYRYDSMKGMAWTSLFVWPIAIVFGLLMGILYGIGQAIKSIDKTIDKVLRKGG